MNEKKSIIPSGYYGNSKNNIVIINNFISDQHLKEIKNFCLGLNTFMSIPGDNWDNRVCNNEILKKIDSNIEQILSMYQKKHKDIIENFFDVELKDNVPSVVIWRPGDEQPPHADKENLDGSANLYPENDIASLFYLNDNYVGGEIYFPIQDIQIKLSAGDAVFFPGDINYQHGVTKVISGYRFTCPAFWNVAKNNKIF
jgi:predicted 2-oxoglutarate/Fe(II)-dependent dioxygenase YbiX